MKTFSLDTRLEQDTLPVADLDLCSVRLMNDARFPWLILVPALPDLEEIDQLDLDQRMQLLKEIGQCSHALRACVQVDKLNVGALGNIVRQLHVHVVARTQGDDAWPGPVWGSGTSRPYDRERASALVRALSGMLKPSP
ncbi:HIT family protein [Oleiagrimonas sp. MCCC 1A03011]|uniref:HIT domain-containing protein n=1 Tax=Oleiagrimonas sp. MCCC 1A03011 TaxID=1926883 RepID=UPI000DC23A77|nr:HIT family protein [Oleiagrimonas sp. MCCC 1A03011]RAP59192.1 diadenosine tetraphosphate hydrolase [Oleiagrimonas sp. MCCC 1A03011]